MKTSKETRIKIVMMYLRGKPVKDICKRFGITQPTMHKALRMEGVTPRRNPNTGMRSDMPTIPRRAMKEYVKGATLRELGEKYGVSRQTMCTRLKKWGVTMRAKGGVKMQERNGKRRN